MTNNKAEWFNYQHLPEHLQAASKLFYDVAVAMEELCPTNSDQRTIAFQKLIEVKDAYVRACILNKRASNGQK